MFYTMYWLLCYYYVIMNFKQEEFIMAIERINLLDNAPAYLYNAFTYGKNNIITQEDVANIKKGVILGEPTSTVANSNVTVIPLYEPKVKRDNYLYNYTQSTLTTLLNYAKQQGFYDEIPSVKVLNVYANLETTLLTKPFSNELYFLYLRLTCYLQLYKFKTKAEELDNYISKKSTNIPVDNYVDYVHDYIMKHVHQATEFVSKKYGVIKVEQADSYMQLIAKSLANKADVAIVHKGTFVMVCFNPDFAYQKEFIALLVDKYQVSGEFVTFFINNIETDAIVTAMQNIISGLE